MSKKDWLFDPVKSLRPPDGPGMMPVDQWYRRSRIDSGDSALRRVEQERSDRLVRNNLQQIVWVGPPPSPR